MSDDMKHTHEYKDGKCEVCRKWENVCPCDNCQRMHTEFIALRCMDWKCTEAEVIAHFAALDVATELSPLMGKKVVKDE